jgi:hypothetical protein
VLEGDCFGFMARQTTIIFGNARPLVKECLPVCDGPVTGTGAQQCYDIAFVSGDHFQKLRWRCATRLK